MYVTFSSWVARLVRAAPLVVVAALALAPPSLGANSQWRARWAGNPDPGTVESGQVFPVYVKAENIGTSTWFQGTVRIGTVGPTENPASGQDRLSEFHHESWILPNRPATLEEASVPQGSIGTFEFVMRAPDVAQTRFFAEYFAPVAEGIEWMYACPEWCGVHIPVTVLPAQPPDVTITSSPALVRPGDPIDVTADAFDNVGVERVGFSLDGGPEQAVTAAPYRHQFSSAGLEGGTHFVTARAYDRTGRTDDAIAAFRIPGGVDPGTVSINGGAPYTRRAAVTVTVGAPPGTTGIQISNDRGFRDAPVQPVRPSYDHTLEDLGDRDTQVVYVHFIRGDRQSVVASDNIVLDARPPTILNAAVRPPRTRRGHGKPLVRPAGAALTKNGCRRRFQLRTRARDNASKVRRLRYGFSRRSFGRSFPFRAQTPVTVPRSVSAPRLMYVRVYDGAGNVSKTRRVSLRPVCG